MGPPPIPGNSYRYQSKAVTKVDGLEVIENKGGAHGGTRYGSRMTWAQYVDNGSFSLAEGRFTDVSSPGCIFFEGNGGEASGRMRSQSETAGRVRRFA